MYIKLKYKNNYEYLNLSMMSLNETVDNVENNQLTKSIMVKSPMEHKIYDTDYKSVFLAGSIEMGAAVDWQTALAKELENEKIVFFNPRRDDWDSSWEQTIENDKFKEQVLWELNHLKNADIIVMYFDPNTKSPVSMAELGLFINNPNLIVCCPKGFWRKGNVDIICQEYSVKTVDSFSELSQSIKSILHPINS